MEQPRIEYWIAGHVVYNFPPFVTIEGLLACLLKAVTSPCPESDESSLHTYNPVSLKLTLILSSYISEMVCSLQDL
jgi:hypothetical protein